MHHVVSWCTKAYCRYSCPFLSMQAPLGNQLNLLFLAGGEILFFLPIDPCRQHRDGFIVCSNNFTAAGWRSTGVSFNLSPVGKKEGYGPVKLIVRTVGWVMLIKRMATR